MIRTPQTSASPSSRGSGFTNLQRYLSANRGNELGNVVSGGITSQAQGVRSDLGSAQEQFQSGMQAGNLASDANRQAREAVLNRLSSGNLNTIQPVTDPEVEQFAKFRGGQYAGPTSLSNVSGLQSKARGVENLGKSVSSAEGRTGLLQSFVGTPQYTQGQQKVDSYLLGQAPQLAQARQKTQGLVGEIGRESQKAGAQASQRAAEAQKFGQETQQMLQGQRGELDTTLQARLAAAQQAADAAQAAFVQGQQGGRLTAADQQLLGLAGGTPLYNLNLADPRFYSESDPTMSGVASAQQRAQAQALAKLSGQDLSQYFQGLDVNAPTYDPSKPYTFNKGAFDQEAARIKGIVDQTVANTKIQHPQGPQFGEVSLPEAQAYIDRELRDAEGRLRNTGSFAVPAAERKQFEDYIKKMQDQKALVQEAYNKATAQYTPGRTLSYAPVPETGNIPAPAGSTAQITPVGSGFFSGLFPDRGYIAPR